VIVQAQTDQQMVLRYLYERLAGGDQRYCTIPTIQKNTAIDASNQYVLTLTDDLEMQGLIMTRQAYQMKGGRLFQITGKGVDFIDSGEQIPASSASWTGRLDVSEVKKEQIQKHLAEMRRIVEAAKMTNAQRCNILAVVGAMEKLVEAPDPQWPEVIRLIRNPTLSGVVGIASLLITIFGLIVPASRLSE
jgi:hypothetical protein